jgi:hypothetical protein
MMYLPFPRKNAEAFLYCGVSLKETGGHEAPHVK